VPCRSKWVRANCKTALVLRFNSARDKTQKEPLIREHDERNVSKWRTFILVLKQMSC
jgi:hypothetical protein